MGCVPRVYSKVVLDGLRQRIERFSLTYMKMTSIVKNLNFPYFSIILYSWYANGLYDTPSG